MATTQGFELDARTQERLQELGRLRDRSPHYLMLTAIEEFLDREEARENEKREDRERWERYQLNGEHVSNEQVCDWLEKRERGEKSERPR